MPTPTKITMLWIVVLINMAFADILSLFYPGAIDEVASGVVEGVVLTPVFLLVAAVFIEIGIVMIFLTGTLAPRTSRIANLTAAAFTILFVVGGGSLKLHYIFFGSAEVIALLYIAYLAWNWRNCEPA